MIIFATILFSIYYHSLFSDLPCCLKSSPFDFLLLFSNEQSFPIFVKIISGLILNDSNFATRFVEIFKIKILTTDLKLLNTQWIFDTSIFAFFECLPNMMVGIHDLIFSPTGKSIQELMPIFSMFFRTLFPYFWKRIEFDSSLIGHIGFHSLLRNFLKVQDFSQYLANTFVSFQSNSNYSYLKVGSNIKGRLHPTLKPDLKDIFFTEPPKLYLTITDVYIVQQILHSQTLQGDFLPKIEDFYGIKDFKKLTEPDLCLKSFFNYVDVELVSNKCSYHKFHPDSQLYPEYSIQLGKDIHRAKVESVDLFLLIPNFYNSEATDSYTVYARDQLGQMYSSFVDHRDQFMRPQMINLHLHERIFMNFVDSIQSSLFLFFINLEKKSLAKLPQFNSKYVLSKSILSFDNVQEELFLNHTIPAIDNLKKILHYFNFIPNFLYQTWELERKIKGLPNSAPLSLSKNLMRIRYLLQTF